MANVNKDNALETTLVTTLVTVAYGATFAYGLTIWDKTSIKPLNVAYLIFIYAFLIADWFNIYVNLRLHGYSRKKLFIFDIIILFLISRVMSASVSTEIVMYWWFMFIIFVASAVWDIVVQRAGVWSESQANWLSNLIGDIITFVIIFAFCIHFIPSEILPPLLSSVFLLFVCTVATINWLKPIVSWFAKKS